MWRSLYFWVSECRLYTHPRGARFGSPQGVRVDAPRALWYSQPNEPGENRLGRRDVSAEPLATPRPLAAARPGGQALAGSTGAGDRSAGSEFRPAVGGALLPAGHRLAAGRAWLGRISARAGSGSPERDRPGRLAALH